MHRWLPDSATLCPTTKATNGNEQRWFAVLRNVGRHSKECREWIREYRNVLSLPEILQRKV